MRNSYSILPLLRPHHILRPVFVCPEWVFVAEFLNVLMSLTLVTVDQSICLQCESVPAAVGNAFINITSNPPFTEGTVGKYTCDRGFGLRGYTPITTCENGEWTSANFECRPVSCPYVERPTNGRITGNPTYLVGSNIVIGCNPGFNLIGQATLTCRVDGRWSLDPPTCRAKDCGHFPYIANAHTIQSTSRNGRNHYQSRVRVTCADQHILNGNMYVECEESGSWGERPTCTEVTCPPYPGLNSSCVMNSLYLSPNLYIACEESETISVTNTAPDVDGIHCGDNEWSDLTKACYCDCKLPDATDVIFQGLNQMDFLPHSMPLQWMCLVGDEQNRNISLTCYDGNLVTEDGQISSLNVTTFGWNLCPPQSTPTPTSIVNNHKDKDVRVNVLTTPFTKQKRESSGSVVQSGGKLVLVAFLLGISHQIFN